MSSTGMVVMLCLNLCFLDGAFCCPVEVCIQVSKFKGMVLSLDSVKRMAAGKQRGMF